MDYACMSLARVEAIDVFHKSRKLGFQFGTQPFKDACDLGIRMYVKVRILGRSGPRGVERTSLLGRWLDKV